MPWLSDALPWKQHTSLLLATLWQELLLGPAYCKGQGKVGDNSRKCLRPPKRAPMIKIYI